MTSDLSTDLTPQERSTLASCEAKIQRGLKTFYEVGTALLEIQKSRLYRGTHGTFTLYCQEKWGIERAHAYRLMHAAKVTDTVSPIGDTPRTESQTRELARLPTDDQADAWNSVVTAQGGAEHVTAKDVREEVQRRLHREPEHDAETPDVEDEAEVEDEADGAPARNAPVEPTHGQVIEDWLKDYMRQEGISGPVIGCILESLAPRFMRM